MNNPFPELTPFGRTGELRCASQPALGAPTCGDPATWHVAWNLTSPADFSLVCDDHMAGVRRDFVYADLHPAEAECDLPGTAWLLGNPSRCVITTTEAPATARAHATLERTDRL
jgi:hypothetical protein